MMMVFLLQMVEGWQDAERKIEQAMDNQATRYEKITDRTVIETAGGNFQ